MNQLDHPNIVHIFDAGMTEVIRPALYGARHPVFALTSLGRDAGSEPCTPTLVEGPVCESTDRLGMVDLPGRRMAAG